MNNATSFEGMIGAAILGDDAEKEKQLRRYDCKLYAMKLVMCGCGQIHDQKKIQLLCDESGEVRTVSCPACREKGQATATAHAEKNPGVYDGWTWQNWNDSSPVIRERPLIDEPLSQAMMESGHLVIAHVGDSPSPVPAKKTPTVRALSVKQILAGGSRSEIRKELYEKTGLLTDGKILLNTRPEQQVSDAFIPMEKPCREVLAGKTKVIAEPSGIVFEVIEQGGDEVSLTNFVDKDGTQLCRVQSAYLKTAEKMTKVKTWEYVTHEILPRIIGQDKDGRTVAAIAIVNKTE